MRAQEILATLSLILFYAAVPLLLPLGYAYYFKEASFESIALVVAIMMAPSIPVFVPGFFKWVFKSLKSTFNLIFRKEAYWNFAVNILTKRPELSELKFGDILAVTSLSWIIIPILTSYPYIAAGMPIENAIFESMSGWTSTGLSILTTFDGIPNSLILFRSVTQWIGGLGIILLMLSLLKHRQAKNLLAFEAKGSMELGIQNTASKIWKIYIGLTILAIALLVVSGFDLFDATNLGFAGLSNGGFFPFLTYDFIWIQKVILALTMFLGAVSFVTYNKVLSGKLKALIAQEFLLFIALILVGIGLITAIGHEQIQNTLLNTVSAIACGGFAIGNLAVMHQFSIYVLIILMISGGMYGSTTGGLKLWRILVALKLVWGRIRSYFLPTGSVQVISVDGNSVDERTLTDVLGFIFMYLVIFLICAGIFMAWDYGLVDSMFTIASAMGNVGLSTLDMSILPIYAKAFLVIVMYVGRIEIFPVLALFRFISGRR